MKDKNCFILVVEKFETITMNDSLFADILKRDDVFKIEEIEFRQKWKQLLISNKGQKLTHGCLNWLLKKQYNWLNQADYFCKEYRNVFVIFINSSFVFHRPPAEFMIEKKECYNNLFYILFYYDSISRKICNYTNYLRSRNVFDYIYTFDQRDAKEYNLTFWNTPYSIVLNANEADEIEWDLYFCAKIKNRENEVTSVLNAGLNHITIHMDLVPNSDDEQDFTSEFGSAVSLRKAGDWLPYTEVLQRIKKTNCILDICLAEQRGMSLRPYEAVAYNKKLLTTNPEIIHFKYYDERYMKFYRTVEDIDWEWVKKKEKIDYGYIGDFSPNYLLEDIERQLFR